MLAHFWVLIRCSLSIISLESVIFVIEDIPTDDQIVFLVGIDKAWLIYVTL